MGLQNIDTKAVRWQIMRVRNAFQKSEQAAKSGLLYLVDRAPEIATHIPITGSASWTMTTHVGRLGLSRMLPPTVPKAKSRKAGLRRLFCDLVPGWIGFNLAVSPILPSGVAG